MARPKSRARSKRQAGSLAWTSCLVQCGHCLSFMWQARHSANRLLRARLFGFLAILLLAFPGRAGDPSALMRQVVLPAENKEVAARLTAADRLIAPDPSEVAALLAGLNKLAPWSGLGAAAAQTER